ncbi:MAG TPA: type II toxin-antitoxin system VapC family toxin [Polyangiaceae bacterium]|nr:type II toxin-antitoxin system VapC family toxin [Polyangiaceae bacterium]
MIVHLDTDFLVYAVSAAGAERRRLLAIADKDLEIQMSTVAWYEFSRGPRTPEQLAVARSFFGESGLVPFDEVMAALAADVFRMLGSPRKRAADIAIGVTCAAAGAVLLTRNRRDFTGIPNLRIETVRSVQE